jgi:nucleotide-binding universal stress UspA family protein
MVLDREKTSMTFKTLIVHVEPEWGSVESLAAALPVARMFDAHIVGVSAEAFDPIVYTGEVPDGGLVQLLRDDIAIDITVARTRFTQAMNAAPAGSTFVSGMDRPHTLLKRYARGADLLVARRIPSGSSATNLCRPTDLLMDVGAPVLLAPQGAPPLEARKIVVAWKDCREARRALADALPFLARAETVAIAAFCPGPERDEVQAELREVAERLARHGVKSEMHLPAPSGAPVASDLEDFAARLGADLIIAGAYSHNRLSEWVLGGVTQDLLIDCSRYVFFSR